MAGELNGIQSDKLVEWIQSDHRYFRYAPSNKASWRKLEMLPNFPELIERGRIAAGGIPKLSKILGINRRTVEAWASGQNSGPKSYATLVTVMEQIEDLEKKAFQRSKK